VLLLAVNLNLVAQNPVARDVGRAQDRAKMIDAFSKIDYSKLPAELRYLAFGSVRINDKDQVGVGSCEVSVTTFLINVTEMEFSIQFYSDAAGKKPIDKPVGLSVKLSPKAVVDIERQKSDRTFTFESLAKNDDYYYRITMGGIQSGLGRVNIQNIY